MLYFLQAPSKNCLITHRFPSSLTCPSADIRHPSQVSTASAFSADLHFCPHSHLCDVSQLFLLLLSFFPPVFSCTTCSPFAGVFQALQYFLLMSAPLWTSTPSMNHILTPVALGRTGSGCLGAQLTTARRLSQSQWNGDFLSLFWLKLAKIQH